MEVLRLDVQSVIGRQLKTGKQRARFHSYASQEARKCIYKMLQCRTGQLGGHALTCEQCSGKEVRLNTCSQRACCVCSRPRRTMWKERVKSWALNCDYLHVVFTVPHELNDWMFASRQNKIELFRQIMKTSIDCLVEVAKREFGCEPGVITTLHTWGQKLNRHVHVHVIMTAGGLSADGTQWIPIRTTDAAMQPKALGDAFKKMYLQRLKYRKTTKKLDEPGDSSRRPLREEAFLDLVTTIASKSWMVDVQATPPEYSGIDGVVNYLAAYISGGPIGNNRILSDDGETITFKIKDYKHDRPGEEKLPGPMFLQRFTDHILPKSVQRVRYAGLFRPQARKQCLDACKARLAEYFKAHDLKAPKSVEKIHEEERDAGVRDYAICSQCESKMAREKTLTAPLMMRIVKHASLLVLQLIADPAADIRRLISENWRAWNEQDRRMYGCWFTPSEFAYLQTWIRQEIARIEAREASEEPEPQAHPPPKSDHGGRDAA